MMSVVFMTVHTLLGDNLMHPTRVIHTTLGQSIVGMQYGGIATEGI